MWRAQPSLSEAACPAGSKTSCCESFIIFWLNSLSVHLPFFSLFLFLSSPLWTWAALSAFVVVFFIISCRLSTFLSSPLPFSQISIPSAFYPCIVPRSFFLSASAPPPSTTLSSLLLSSLPRHFCLSLLSSLFSTLAFFHPLSLLLCHFC